MTPGQSRGSPKLRRQFSWALVGNAFYALCQAGMLVVAARLTSPEQVGQFALGLAIAGPIFIFANLKLRQVQATDAAKEFDLSDYLGLRVASTAAALAATFGVLGFASYGSDTGWIILLVSLAKAFESFSDLIYGALQRRERLDLVARAMGARGATGLTFLTVGLVVGESMVWGVAGMAAAFLVGVARDAQQLRRVTGQPLPFPRFSATTQARLFRLTLPLGFVTMLGSLQANLPRYAIENHLGPHDLGIFAALAYLLVPGTTIVGALSQAAVSRLATLHANGQRSAFRDLVWRMVWAGVGLGFIVVLLSYAAGAPLLHIVYGSEYAGRADVLVWLAGAALLRYSYAFLGTAANAMRRYRFQPVVHLAGSLAVASVSWTFIPDHGLVAAAWGLLAGAFVEGVGYAWAALPLLSANAWGTSS